MSTSKRRFVICIDNAEYEASLIQKNIYEMIRVIDESGEDYLYHRSHFIFVELPDEVEKALITA